MNIEEISGDTPATTKVYQINSRDLVDIGGNGLIDDSFETENVEKVALTCSWIEHSENLNHIQKSKGVFAKIKEPTVYCASPEELVFGEKDWIEPIEDGQEIEISDYSFEAIIVEIENSKEAMFYNEEHKVLFSGDIQPILSQKQKIDSGSLDRLKEVSNWKIEEVYPAIEAEHKENDNVEHFKKLVKSI